VFGLLLFFFCLGSFIWRLSRSKQTGPVSADPYTIIIDAATAGSWGSQLKADNKAWILSLQFSIDFRQRKAGLIEKTPNKRSEKQKWIMDATLSDKLNLFFNVFYWLPIKSQPKGDWLRTKKANTKLASRRRANWHKSQNKSNKTMQYWEIF